MTNPGIIRVDANVEGNIAADGAVLHIIIAGDSFFYGSAALEKSQELREFIANVKSIGVDDTAIQIKDIQVVAKTGRFGTASSASYRLAMKLLDLSLLPKALGLVTGQKNINLSHIEWLYSQEEAHKEQLLRTCLELALKRARIMAEVVGQKIQGIRSLADSYGIPRAEVQMSFAADSFERARVAASPMDIGTSFSNEKKISVQVSAEFLVENSVVMYSNDKAVK